jgi:hypothetical protein
MKVVGFSFIRNAVKFDYPIVESITSILPICDEFIIALGNSDDNTEDLIKSIDGLYRALLVFIIMLLSSLAWPYCVLKAVTRKR